MIIFNGRAADQNPRMIDSAARRRWPTANMRLAREPQNSKASPQGFHRINNKIITLRKNKLWSCLPVAIDNASISQDRAILQSHRRRTPAALCLTETIRVYPVPSVIKPHI